MQPAPYIVQEVGSHPAEVVSVFAIRSDQLEVIVSDPVAAKSNYFGLVGGGLLALRAAQQTLGS